MNNHEIKPNVHWVGARDWNVRNFHGYKTQRGTTYNSYLILDEKVTLVDNVKAEFSKEHIDRIKEIIDPAKIDYIITNHIEEDHSGAILDVLEIAPNAQIIASPIGKKGLIEMYGIDETKIDAVKNGEKLSIGENELTFVHMGMIHWPDSMLTYVENLKLILSNDAFGQHYCSSNLFSDEVPAEDLFYETAKYYANIVLPYGAPVSKALSGLSSLEVDMIAPSHGLIWRDQIDRLLSSYSDWAMYKSKNKAVVVYDTMWKTTEKIAEEIAKIFDDSGIPVVLMNLSANHYSDVICEILEANFVAIGSPSLNGQIMPSVAAFTTYMKGLKPQNKTGFAFGSYGWSQNFLDDIESTMGALKWNVPVLPFKAKSKVSDDALAKLRKSFETITN